MPRSKQQKPRGRKPQAKRSRKTKAPTGPPAPSVMRAPRAVTYKLDRASRRGKSSSSGLAGVARSALMSNALAYVNCLYDPCGPSQRGVRVPDLIAIPTATAYDVTRVTFSNVTNGGSTATWTVAVTPIMVSSATQTVGSFMRANWGGIPGDNYGANPVQYAPAIGASVGATAEFFRTVACGVKFRNIGQLMGRGGILKCWRSSYFPSMAMGVASPGPAISGPQVAEIDLASDGLGSSCHFWLPSDYDTALSFIPADSTAYAHGTLMIQIIFPTAGVGVTSATASLELEVHTHIEYVPKPGVAALMNTASVTGSTADVAGVVAEVATLAGGAVGAATNIVSGQLSKAVHTVAMGARQVADAGFGGLEDGTGPAAAAKLAKRVTASVIATHPLFAELRGDSYVSVEAQERDDMSARSSFRAPSTRAR